MPSDKPIGTDPVNLTRAYWPRLILSRQGVLLDMLESHLCVYCAQGTVREIGDTDFAIRNSEMLRMITPHCCGQASEN